MLKFIALNRWVARIQKIVSCSIQRNPLGLSVTDNLINIAKRQKDLLFRRAHHCKICLLDSIRQS